MPSSPKAGIYTISPVNALKVTVPVAVPVPAFTIEVVAPGKKSSFDNIFTLPLFPSTIVIVSGAVDTTNGFGSVVSGFPSLSSSKSSLSGMPSPSVSKGSK